MNADDDCMEIVIALVGGKGRFVEVEAGVTGGWLFESDVSGVSGAYFGSSWVSLFFVLG